MEFKNESLEPIRVCNDINESAYWYRLHLLEHIHLVQKYFERLVPYFGEFFILDPLVFEDIRRRVVCHDMRKFEYDAFNVGRQILFPVQGELQDTEGYRSLVKGHIRSHDHHQEYWISDNGTEVSEQYSGQRLCASIEMLCDWFSVATQTNNDCVTWFERNRDNIVLASELEIIIPRMVHLYPRLKI